MRGHPGIERRARQAAAHGVLDPGSRHHLPRPPRSDRRDRVCGPRRLRTRLSDERVPEVLPLERPRQADGAPRGAHVDLGDLRASLRLARRQQQREPQSPHLERSWWGSDFVECWDMVVGGTDFVVTSGTGSGKSLTYIGTIFNHLLANRGATLRHRRVLRAPRPAAIAMHTVLPRTQGGVQPGQKNFSSFYCFTQPTGRNVDFRTRSARTPSAHAPSAWPSFGRGRSLADCVSRRARRSGPGPCRF